MRIIYRKVKHKVGLTLSPADRYIWLRKVNEIMAGDYGFGGSGIHSATSPTASSSPGATGGPR